MFISCINCSFIVKFEYVYNCFAGFLDNFNFFCPARGLVFNIGKIKTTSKIKMLSADMNKRMLYYNC